MGGEEEPKAAKPSCGHKRGRSASKKKKQVIESDEDFEDDQVSDEAKEKRREK